MNKSCKTRSFLCLRPHVRQRPASLLPHWSSSVPNRTTPWQHRVCCPGLLVPGRPRHLFGQVGGLLEQPQAMAHPMAVGILTGTTVEGWGQKVEVLLETRIVGMIETFYCTEGEA